MKIGIIGCGVVGGTLYRWLLENTRHQIARLDPARKLADDLSKSDAIFICIPVEPDAHGQDQHLLKDVVMTAKGWSEKVFIRSTVLPGTNDELGTISNPEFLTDRQADSDMRNLPVLVGHIDRRFISRIFKNKEIRIVGNKEAELAKYAHNCFGAMKVTYFNIIKDLSERMGISYEHTLYAANCTGYLGSQHLQVPGPDGKYGYSGKCFPPNIESFKNYLGSKYLNKERSFFEAIQDLNEVYRQKEVPKEKETGTNEASGVL